MLSAADARVASAATSAGGTATVVASRRGGTVVFTSSGLPVLPPSSVYELWFIGSAGVRPAGLVPAPDPDGAAAVPVLATGLSGGRRGRRHGGAGRRHHRAHHHAHRGAHAALTTWADVPATAAAGT